MTLVPYERQEITCLPCEWPIGLLPHPSVIMFQSVGPVTNDQSFFPCALILKLQWSWLARQTIHAFHRAFPQWFLPLKSGQQNLAGKSVAVGLVEQLLWSQGFIAFFTCLQVPHSLKLIWLDMAPFMLRLFMACFCTRLGHPAFVLKIVTLIKADRCREWKWLQHSPSHIAWGSPRMQPGNICILIELGLMHEFIQRYYMDDPRRVRDCQPSRRQQRLSN